MEIKQLLEQKKARGIELGKQINSITNQINALEKQRQELLTEAVKNNGAIEALNELKQ